MDNLSLNRNIDVFISYSSKDEDTANMIVEGLSERGVRCWKAGEYTINSGEDFRQKIADALNECKIFLIILSKNSMASPWCKIELTEALRKNKKIYSLKVDNSPIDELFDFKLGCSQTSDGTKNLIPVIENLSINIKKDRDAILEREKSKIYTKAKSFHIFDLLTVNNIFLLVCLGITIFGAINSYNYFETTFKEDFLSDYLDVLTGYIVSGFFAIMMYFIFRIVYKNLVKANIELDCPSANYLYFKLNYKIFPIQTKNETALLHLQKAANGGDYRALKKLAKFYEQGTLVKKDLNRANELNALSKEEKAKHLKKITSTKKSITILIIYFALILLIYACALIFPSFYLA